MKAKPNGCSNCEQETKQISIKEFGTEVSVTGDKKICAGATTKLKAELTKCEEACDKGFAWTVKEGPARVKPDQDSSDKATLKMNKDAEKGEMATVVAMPKCEALSDVKDSAEVSVKPCKIELTSEADGAELCPGETFSVQAETNCDYSFCTPEFDFIPTGPIVEQSDGQNTAQYRVKEDAKHDAEISVDATLQTCASNCDVKSTIDATVKKQCELANLTTDKPEICWNGRNSATVTAELSSPCETTEDCRVTFSSSGPAQIQKLSPTSVSVTATGQGQITVEASVDKCSSSYCTATTSITAKKPEVDLSVSANADTSEDNPHLFCVEERNGLQEGTIEFDTKLNGPEVESASQTITVNLAAQNDRFPWLSDPSKVSFISKVRIFDVSGEYQDPIVVKRSTKDETINRDIPAAKKEKNNDGANSQMNVKMPDPETLTVTKNWDESSLGATEDIDRIEVVVRSTTWKYDLNMDNKFHGKGQIDTECGDVTEVVEASNSTTGKGKFVYLDITAYRPQHEVFGNGDDGSYSPFQRTEVPEPQEEDPKNGPGIRINCDDDNSNNSPDKADFDNVTNENDLIEVTLEFEQATDGSGSMVLNQTGRFLRVFKDRLKGDQITFNDNGKAFLNENDFKQDKMTVWVEWPGTEHGKADLEFSFKKDDSEGGEAICKDTLTFHSFKSVVIALGGETQEPSDPADPNHGIFQLAIDLYNQGFDVHMYDEDKVLFNGTGTPLDEAQTANDSRKVSELAVFGYSHGGGSTYDLVNEIDSNDGMDISIPFTAYIDAVENGSEIDIATEHRRPPGTVFHMNYYQESSALEGGPINDPPGAEFEVNVDEPDETHTHFSIDDDEDILGNIESSLIDRISR